MNRHMVDYPVIQNQSIGKNFRNKRSSAIMIYLSESFMKKVFNMEKMVAEILDLPVKENGMEKLNHWVLLYQNRVMHTIISLSIYQ